jgi:UDP-D-galactose:(glucosyl)LPS alpha-1,6-D-galactosyltransferase
MTKILFTLDLPSGKGGMENVSRHVATLLGQRNQVRFFLFENNEPNIDMHWLTGLSYALSRCITKNHKIRRFFHILKLAMELVRYKPDIIITLNTVPCYISQKARRLVGCQARLISWMHLPPQDRYRPHYLSLADHHFAISSEIKKQLVTLGINPQKIDVIFNPVTPTEKLIPRGGSTRFLYIGRVHFEDQKQLKDLFDALAQVTEKWTLDIVGDGGDLLQCQEYVTHLGLADRIYWHGWQNEPWQYIEKNICETTALVMTSNHEGFPLVLLEAMARGIYCVSSDCVSGPSEIIKPDINGQLYPPHDIPMLTSILNKLATRPELPQQFVIKKSIEHFYNKNYLSILEEKIELSLGMKNER